MLQVPWVPKSLNKSLNSHWRKRHRTNQEWDAYILAQVQNRKPPFPLARAKISLTRHSHRMLDFDGVVGSLKPVVDALVTAGVLVDDSWNVLGAWKVDQMFRPKKDGQLLEILIEGIDS